MIRTIPLCLATALPVAFPAAAQDVLVPAGSTWSYLDDGTDQMTAWRQASFDDSAWAAGPAQLGYGDGDEATVVGFGGNPNNKYVTTYFRHDFAVANPGLYLALEFRILRDDGVVVYLNGTELVRDNLPSGPIDYKTLASEGVGGAGEDIFYSYHTDPGQLVAGTNVLAVEIHQVAVTSSDISLDLELLGHTEPQITRGPYLQLGTPTSVRVRWRSSPASDSRVIFGDSPSNLTLTVTDPTVTSEHDVELSGLTPDTVYYYAVGDTGQILAGADVDHFFLTAPVAGVDKPTRIWILGDCGTADVNAAGVRDAYLALAGTDHTDLWLMLGDNAYTDGTDAEYQAAVFDMYPSMLQRSVLWSTRGNHERKPGTYFGIFSLPTAGEAGGVPSGTESYYAFNHGNLHFVCLDSYASDRSVGGAMWTWLKADLESTDQDWIVAFWHHPPYSKGSHNSDTEPELIQMRQNFLPLLEDFGVDLVFSGHSHSYERSFLINGHYGNSSTFDDSMKSDGGSGREETTGAYNKAAGAHAGAVYTVAGCSGLKGGGSLNHPAMFSSRNVYGSVILDVSGGRIDARFLQKNGNVTDHFTLLNDTFEGTYCVAGENSDMCQGQIAGSGLPSVSDPGPFLVSASLVPAGQFGMLVYGLSPANAPFVGSGRRCIGAPFMRTAVQSSGGSGACGGSYGLDFNQLIQGGVDPGLIVGTTVYSQYWHRDPSHPLRSALTNALQFIIRP